MNQLYTKGYTGALRKNNIFNTLVAQYYPKSTKSESLVVGPGISSC